jgi:hypothetical protein
MPALPLAPNVIKITLKHIYSLDTDVINRFFMLWAGTAPVNADMHTFASSVHSIWAGNVAPLCHPDVSLVQVEAVDLTTASGAIGIDTTVTAGSRAGTALPAGTAFLLNFGIQRRYRGGKPRMYSPLGAAGDVLDGQDWTSSFHSLALGSMTAFLNQVCTSNIGTTLGHGQVNVGYYSGVYPPTTLPSGRVKQASKPLDTPHIDSVVSITAGTRFASQRRRNRP